MIPWNGSGDEVRKGGTDPRRLRRRASRRSRLPRAPAHRGRARDRPRSSPARHQGAIRSLVDHGDDGHLRRALPAPRRGDRREPRRRAPRICRGTVAGRARDHGADPQVSVMTRPAFQAGYAGSIPVTRSRSSNPPSSVESRDLHARSTLEGPSGGGRRWHRIRSRPRSC